MVDVDDLIDAGEVAELLGLASRKVVAASRSNAPGAWREFPSPVIDRVPCKFWVRQDVERWQASRKPRSRDAEATPESG
jgi:predicted DNA-binding transcriptional regulator AlpA